MKTYIHPPNSAEIMWAYSHGICVNIWNSDMIFVTGQIAMDQSGKAIAPDDIEKQTHYVFESIENILNESWSWLDDVVKAIIYLTNMNDFAIVSPIRNVYFKNSKPVSTLVEINKTVKEWCNIEIEVIAIKQK